MLKSNLNFVIYIRFFLSLIYKVDTLRFNILFDVDILVAGFINKEDYYYKHLFYYLQSGGDSN